MELKYLITFKTILEAGTHQRAAEKLNYSRAAITFQIQQLEQELSIKLFEKIGRRMKVTQAGKELLPYIDSIIKNMEIIENYTKRIEKMSGELSISLPESLLTYKIQNTLKSFREQAPQVQLSLQMQNCFFIREQVMNGKIDFGFHYDVGGYSSNIHIEKLKEFEMSLICSPKFKEDNNDFITPHQRKEICLLTDDKDSIFFSMFLRYLFDKDIVINNILELNSIEAIKQSVISNLGIAFLPHFTVEKELNSGVLEEINTEIKNKKITAILAYHKNKQMSPPMKLFTSLLMDRKNIEF